MKDNLVKKAYELFLKQVIDSNSGKLSNVGFSLKKSIPVSAGLGGGSSDAACALKLLNEEIADYFSIDQLADLGSQIGSDVPACVYSQALWMKGRGEVIELITDINLNDLYVLVVTPTIYCSTPQVFQHYEKMKRPVDDGRETKYLNPLINNIHNDLAIAAFNLYPELNSFKSELNKIVNEEFNLAGSGSTLFLIGEKGKLESHQRAIRDYFDSKKLRLNAVSSLF